MPKRHPVDALPETIRRVGRLEVRARQVVEGYLSGRHASPYSGQSLDFREHRAYVQGDDLRHVDWKVWARQDRMVVKQYDEDTSLRGQLLVDVSASMAYGREGMTKHEYASTAACVLAYLLLRQNDAVGCVAFDEAIRGEAPQRSNRQHLSTVVETVTPAPTDRQTDLAAVLEDAATRLPPRGVVFLISDLMGDLTGLRRGLSQLRLRGHDTVVLHVLDDDEIDFPFNGPTRFEGLESPDLLSCDPRALRADYLQAIRRFLSEARDTCLAQRAQYALLRTSDPLDAVLTAVLSPRADARRSAAANRLSASKP